MPRYIPSLNVFLSSPGDVADERAIARKIMKRLPNRYGFKQRVTLNIIAWEDPESGTAMPATLTPQEAINRGLPKPSECDIVLVILWSRLGTPFTDKDGQRYESGTQWELLDALNSPAARHTYIYQRTEEPNPGKMDSPRYDENVAQYRRLQAFLASEEFYEGDQIKRAIQQYKTPSDFETIFELRFEEIVARILEALPEDSPPPRPKVTPSPQIEVAETVVWPAGKSPFPGLRAFTQADAPIFFGRERETDALVQRVAASRFVAVVGASGSGKSSLVAAGLLPRLEANAISSETTGSKDWRVVRFTPGSAEHPFAALFDGIVKTFASLRPSALFELRRIKKQFVADMLSDPLTVCDALAGALDEEKAPEWAEVLLFVDQFEELFTVAPPDSIAPFAKMLTAIAEQARLRVVVTVRHDFVHRAIEIPELAELLNLGAFHLAAPTAGALVQMVKRPAELAALEFEDGLPEQMLADMGSDAGALALMAYTLDELYKIADARHDRSLTFAAYEALGGVQGAVGARAEQTFNELALPDKETLLGQVFRDLVEVDERGTATRQRAAQGRFAEDAMTLVRAFTNARLLVTSLPLGPKGEEGWGDEGAVVEVAHEALFRSWERLRDWIAEAQEDLILLRQVRNAAHDWQKRERPAFLLWPQERLMLVYAMQKRLNPELNDVERDFIEPEQERLYRELADIATSHQRRYDIGERLARIGDYREGIGAKDGIPDIAWLPVEVPAEPVTIKTDEGEIGPVGIRPFFIAKYLVTFVQFQAFIDSGEYDDVRWWDGFPQEYQPQKARKVTNGNANAPRDTISWYQSVAFSRWLNHHLQGLEVVHVGTRPALSVAAVDDAGVVPTRLIVGDNAEIRLPTEWEWQWAAQGGVKEWKYPWGEWDAHPRANTTEAGINDRSTSVGMYPHGAALCGALDLSGNLWEWCLNDHGNPEITDGYSNSKRKVLRGGSFLFSLSYAAASSRCYYSDPYSGSSLFGVRVVLSPLS